MPVYCVCVCVCVCARARVRASVRPVVSSERKFGESALSVNVDISAKKLQKRHVILDLGGRVHASV
jgi:hypothetical protein